MNNSFGLRRLVSDDRATRIHLPVTIKSLGVANQWDLVRIFLLVRSDHTLLRLVVVQPFEKIKSFVCSNVLSFRRLLFGGVPPGSVSQWARGLLKKLSAPSYPLAAWGVLFSIWLMLL